MAPRYLKAFLVTGLLAVSACADTGRIDPLNQGPRAPVGTKQITEAVDGLIVGHRLMAAGEYELALRAYTRAAGEQGFNPDIYSALGSANLMLGRLGQAETLLNAAVKRDENFVAAWNNLGVIYISQGQVRAAERAFRRAFALDSGKSDEIRTNLKRALEKLEETDYSVLKQEEFELVRRGNGRYLLLETANSI